MDNSKTMNQILTYINQWFEDNQQWITDVSDRIWELAEVKFTEFQSMAVLVEQFKKYGFKICLKKTAVFKTPAFFINVLTFQNL